MRAISRKKQEPAFLLDWRLKAFRHWPVSYTHLYIMSGELMMSYNQLQLALGLPGLNAIQRARFSARLDEVRAALPKDRQNTTAGQNGNGR